MTERFMHTLQFFAGDTAAENAGTDAEGRDETDAPKEDGDPEAAFEELIKGKYADEFRKRTQSIIDRRFAKMKGLEKTASLLEPVLNAFRGKFPDADGGDPESLVNAFLDAEKTREADDGRRALLSHAGEQASAMAQERLLSRWEKEARELKELYPSFSLGDEMKNNGGFASLLKAGVPVRLAFEAANLEKIMGAGMKYAAAAAGRKAAASLRDSAARVQENSVLGRASSITKRDVSALTEKDILKIINEVGKGAVISF